MPTTSKHALRYPASSDAPAGYTQIQNLATDVDNEMLRHTGSTGAIVGTVPPVGTQLIVKTIKEQIVTNASGDASLTYPGAAFPNGVLTAQVTTATAQPIVWVLNATGNSTSVLAVHGYVISPYGPAASLSVASTVIVIGW